MYILTYFWYEALVFVMAFRAFDFDYRLAPKISLLETVILVLPLLNRAWFQPYSFQTARVSARASNYGRLSSTPALIIVVEMLTFLFSTFEFTVSASLLCTVDGAHKSGYTTGNFDATVNSAHGLVTRGFDATVWRHGDRISRLGRRLMCRLRWRWAAER